MKTAQLFSVAGGLLDKMRSIVESEMNLYKSDFAKYDIPQIFETIYNYGSVSGYWFIRDTGTNILIRENFTPADFGFFNDMFSMYQGSNTVIYNFSVTSGGVTFNKIYDKNNFNFSFNRWFWNRIY